MPPAAAEPSHERTISTHRAPLLLLKGNIDVQIISSQLPAARGATRKLHYSRASVFRYIGRVCMGLATALPGPRSTAGRHFRTAPAARRWWCLVGSAGSPDYHRSLLGCRCARCLRAVLDVVRKQSEIHPVRERGTITGINLLVACKLSCASLKFVRVTRLCSKWRRANILLGSLSQARTVHAENRAKWQKAVRREMLCDKSPVLCCAIDASCRVKCVFKSRWRMNQGGFDDLTGFERRVED